MKAVSWLISASDDALTKNSGLISTRRFGILRFKGGSRTLHIVHVSLRHLNATK